MKIGVRKHNIILIIIILNYYLINISLIDNHPLGHYPLGNIVPSSKNSYYRLCPSGPVFICHKVNTRITQSIVRRVKLGRDITTVVLYM